MIRHEQLIKIVTGAFPVHCTAENDPTRTACYTVLGAIQRCVEYAERQSLGLEATGDYALMVALGHQCAGQYNPKGECPNSHERTTVTGEVPVTVSKT